MRKYLSQFALLAFLILAALEITAQSNFRILARCQGTRSTYGSITATPTDIFQTPCPTRATIFNGNVDFENATILAPFRMLDNSFVNFQGYDSYLSIGNDPASPINIPNSGGLYPLNVEMELRGNGTATGVYSRLSISAPSATAFSSPAIGVFGIVQNPTDLDTNRTLTGVVGYAYQRQQTGSARATGGDFTAVTGGNLGALNPTPLYGIRATAQGGHNGTSPLVVGGYFNVSNIGGGGVGNITEGVAVQALFDGGFPTTNYVTAKGIALQGWGAANGGTYTNSYGIYADTSIDRGTADRFFIYSLSTSPSLFSGVVRVAQDVYVSDNTKGIVLRSPDGTCYRFTVANGGALNAGAAIACP